MAADDDTDDAGNGVTRSDSQRAAENWSRYEYGMDRGHREYCRVARRLEDFYLGGGEQYTEADRKALQKAKRPALEFNEIMPAVNSAIGYQIANRMDISFRPRGGAAQQEIATVLSKVAMQIADNIDLHHKETEVFGDGLIQRRGYFEVRISFDDSMRGEAVIDSLDALDVIPDPDSKSYDPDGWGDVIVTRWLTLDQIEGRYGKEARRKAEAGAQGVPSNLTVGDPDFGDDDGEERNKMGDGTLSSAVAFDALMGETRLQRLRVIDRQVFVWELCKVLVTPDTGDIRVVEGIDEAQLANMVAAGGIVTQRMARRVRWIVSTWDALLFDGYSPYPWFTVVPYFYIFRRGRGRSMVDNAVGPQEALNKGISQFIHVVNTSANSGWMVEDDSLVDMNVDELKQVGAKAGLVLVVKKNAQFPKKIEPNEVPAGLDRIVDRCLATLKENTLPDAARGLDDEAVSGVSRQSKAFAAQKQIALPLDNLGRSRNMLARRLLWLIQNYYDDERVFRITKQDPATGEDQVEELRVNVQDPKTGAIFNDLRVGEYDVVVTEQPMQITFENGQFEQALKMKEVGVDVPPDVLVRNSNLADKNELLQRMAKAPAAPADPRIQAEADLKAAQAQETRTKAVAKAVEAQFSAIQTAQTIAMTPQTAPLADQLLRSAGFEDQDAAPIVPELPQAIAALDMPTNTNPLTPLNPTNPAVGLDAGIEGGQSTQENPQ